MTEERDIEEIVARIISVLDRHHMLWLSEVDIRNLIADWRAKKEEIEQLRSNSLTSLGLAEHMAEHAEEAMRRKCELIVRDWGTHPGDIFSAAADEIAALKP